MKDGRGQLRMEACCRSDQIAMSPGLARACPSFSGSRVGGWQIAGSILVASSRRSQWPGAHSFTQLLVMNEVRPAAPRCGSAGGCARQSRLDSSAGGGGVVRLCSRVCARRSDCSSSSMTGSLFACLVHDFGTIWGQAFKADVSSRGRRWRRRPTLAVQSVPMDANRSGDG